MEQDVGRERRSGEQKRRLSTEVWESSHQRLTHLKAQWGKRSFGAVIDQLLIELYGPDPACDVEIDPSITHTLQVQTEAAHPGDSAAASGSSESRTVSRRGIDPAATGADAAGAGIEDNQSASNNGTDVSEHDPSTMAETDALPSRPLEQGVESEAAQESHADSLFDETGALVLVHREGNLEASLEFPIEEDFRPRAQQRSSGIELPGFVRRNTEKLRRSLNQAAQTAAARAEILPAIAESDLQRALETVSSHWIGLYGQAANDAVVEASMAWLAHDIWTQSDLSEGEAFTWGLAQHLIIPCAPGWLEGPPSLERVIVLAGLLEDPFSASTLSLRIPTLIRRFVHRFRRRRQGASFQTLEHTMTLHGALKLLQIPIDSGQRLTLPVIREAYREMALNHHPDAGGSEEMMRRLNEAYQLLKELYRQKTA